MKEEKNVENIEKFLDEIRSRYGTGGIWLARRMGRRVSFFCGFKPEGISPPEQYELDDKFILFVEDDKRFKKAKKTLLKTLKDFLKKL